MGAVRRRLKGAAQDDRGLSLVELLVTMSMLTMVMAGVTAAFISTSRAVGAANHTMTDIAHTRVAMDRITTLIRSAVDEDGNQPRSQPAFEVTSSSDVTFYSVNGLPRGQGPDRVRLYVDGSGELVEEVIPASGGPGAYTWPTTDRRTRVLARGLTTTDIFEFYTHRDPAAPCGLQLVPTSGNLTVSERQSLDTIDITLSLRGESAYSNGTSTLLGRARLANAFQLGRIQDYNLWDDLPEADRYCE